MKGAKVSTPFDRDGQMRPLGLTTGMVKAAPLALWHLTMDFTLYILNLHSVICQLHLNKLTKKNVTTFVVSINKYTAIKPMPT